MDKNLKNEKFRAKDFKKTTKQDLQVKAVISKYNERFQSEQAIKGGTRRPRNSDEEKVLNSFKLK